MWSKTTGLNKRSILQLVLENYAHGTQSASGRLVKDRYGPSCSKLTMSLVNVSLKFQTLILQIHCYFLLKKCENPLHCKGFSHFFNKK